MTFLSQLDPVYFTNSVNKETIEKSYKSFFQIFGGEHVSLMLRGAGEEGRGVTTGAGEEGGRESDGGVTLPTG